MITSRKRSDGFPEPPPSAPARQPSHRGHGWMMAVVCLPMIAIGVLLVATGVASAWFLLAAAMCALMMVLMMRGMG